MAHPRAEEFANLGSININIAKTALGRPALNLSLQSSAGRCAGSCFSAGR